MLEEDVFGPYTAQLKVLAEPSSPERRFFLGERNREGPLFTVYVVSDEDELIWEHSGTRSVHRCQDTVFVAGDAGFHRTPSTDRWDWVPMEISVHGCLDTGLVVSDDTRLMVLDLHTSRPVATWPSGLLRLSR